MQRVVINVNGNQKLVKTGLSIGELILSLGVGRGSIITINGRIWTMGTPRWIKKGDSITISNHQKIHGNLLRGIAKSVGRKEK